MRSTEPGWVLCAMNDPTGRRGIWYRETRDELKHLTVLEVCAGREGDDWYAKLEAGKALDPRELQGLFDCLDTGAWMVDDHLKAEKEEEDD